MSGYLDHLLKGRSTDMAANTEHVDPRLHDADGKQLVQSTTAGADLWNDWHEIPAKPNADLSLKSTEWRRSMRLRTRTLR